MRRVPSPDRQTAAIAEHEVEPVQLGHAHSRQAMTSHRQLRRQQQVPIDGMAERVDPAAACSMAAGYRVATVGDRAGAEDQDRVAAYCFREAAASGATSCATRRSSTISDPRNGRVLQRVRVLVEDGRLRAGRNVESAPRGAAKTLRPG